MIILTTAVSSLGKSFLDTMDEKREIGQRGPDKEKREFNPKSLSNLKQFQKPVSEANLSVNSGTNWIKLGKVAIIIIIISGLIWKIYQKKKQPVNVDNLEFN